MTRIINPAVASDAVLERNLKALGRVDARLASLVRQVRSQFRTECLPNTSGLRNIPLAVPERPFYYRDNSTILTASNELDGLDASAARIAVFLGMGLGYQLTHFVRLHAQHLYTERIVIIEKSIDRFRLALETTEMSGLLSDQRITFLVGLDADSLFARLLTLFRSPAFISRLTALALLSHPGDLAEDREYYVVASRQVREAAAEAAQLVGNSPQDSLIGLRNMLANLDVIAENPGINLLKGAFEDYPAIIVSTGPSLNKNISQLSVLQDRSLILAVDASVAPLTAVGVKPHLVVSLERVPQVAELVQGFDLRDSYFAACPVVRPEAYAAYNGPKLIVYRNLSHFAWLRLEKGTLPTGPSAANMAFKIAQYLGANPIVLVGQDLAFGESGTTHAAHAVLGESQELFRRMRIREVAGNHGGSVRTTDVWLRFLRHFQADIHGFHGRCINATEGGAFIPGTEVMSLREAAKCFMTKPFDAQSMIRGRLEGFTFDPTVKESLALRIDESKKDVEAIMHLCSRGIQRAGRFVDRYAHVLADKSPLAEDDRKRVGREVQALFRMRENVERTHPDTYRLLMGLTLQPYLVTFEHRVALLRVKYADRTLELIAWGSMHREWFTRIRALSQLVLDELKRVDLAVLHRTE